MRKFSVTFILLLSVISLSYSQNKQTNKAKDFLDKVANKFYSYNNISIDFSYDLYNGIENVKQKSTGKLLVMGTKYFLETMGIKQIYDGSKVYTIFEEDEEVNISNGLSEDLITPSSILNKYSKGYKISMDILKTEGRKKYQYIRIEPRNERNNHLKYILVAADASTYNLYQLIEVGKNGTTTTFKITDYTVNKPLSSSIFAFNKEKYSDFLINELD